MSGGQAPSVLSCPQGDRFGGPLAVAMTISFLRRLTVAGLRACADRHIDGTWRCRLVLGCRDSSPAAEQEQPPDPVIPYRTAGRRRVDVMSRRRPTTRP